MPSKSTLIAIAILIAAFMLLSWELFVGIAGGLLIGWNVLEQPYYVRKYWDMAVEKITSYI